jgi:hypothetical protein
MSRAIDSALVSGCATSRSLPVVSKRKIGVE